jgi:hypothetical protein
MDKIKLPDGGVIRSGQYLRRAGLDAPAGFGRDGKPKKAVTTTPAITPTMRRVTTGTPSAYHHGVTEQDLPLVGNTKVTGQNVSTHPSMTRQTDPTIGSAIMRDAGHQSWRSGVAAKHADIDKTKSLPTKLMGR